MRRWPRRDGGGREPGLPSLTSMSMWCAELEDLSLLDLDGRELAACSCILGPSSPPPCAAALTLLLLPYLLCSDGSLLGSFPVSLLVAWLPLLLWTKGYLLAPQKLYGTAPRNLQILQTST